MIYYWDSSHFKENVGDWVLDRILDIERPEAPIPADFGIALNTANVEKVIKDTRLAHSEYVRTHHVEVNQIRTWVNKYIEANGIDSNEIVANQI